MLRRCRRHFVTRGIALALVLRLCLAATSSTHAQEQLADAQSSTPREHWDKDVIAFQSPDGMPPTSESWIAPPADPAYGTPGPPVTTYTDPAWGGQPVVLPCPSD